MLNKYAVFLFFECVYLVSRWMLQHVLGGSADLKYWSVAGTGWDEENKVKWTWPFQVLYM